MKFISFIGSIKNLIIADNQKVPVKYEGKIVGHAVLEQESDGKIRVIGEFDETPEVLLDSLTNSGGFSFGQKKYNGGQE